MNTIFASRGLATFALATLPLAIQAAEPQLESPAEATAEATSLNPMVITAALAPRTADETLASVTVLDEATLRRQDPASLPDLLRGQPGVDVTSNGSFGKSSSVSIRGTSNSQSLLMIDGIRLRSATLGGPAWQFLDPRMFERAEIVRGPRGSLYGADAVGGVVQLSTPEGEEGAPQPRVSVGGGSFNTQRYSASLSGGSGGTSYYVAGSRFDTDGTPVRRGGEDKGYDNTSGLVRLSHAFESGAEVGALALRARGNTEFDSFGAPAETDFVQQVSGVYGEIPVSDTWRSRLTLSEARDESDTLDAFGFSVFDTQTRTARWENTLGFGVHELVAGAEYSEDSISSTNVYDETNRDNTAVFAQGLLDFSPVAVQASLRYDDNQAFGEEVTGSLALGYEFDAHHTLRASVGTAFRAPSFNELYFPGFSNPDLNAETSETYELGVRGQYRTLFWDLAAYQSDIDELIINVDTTGDGWVDTPQNVAKARIRGIELATGAEIDDWTLAAALTWTDPENRSGLNAGNRIQRRASQSARFDVDRALGDWTLGASWILQGYRYEDAANTDRLNGFGLVNLRAGWDFAPMWSARLTVENALDKEYETARDYINAGRAAFVSVHFGQ
ncbi:TonB-dependent receptor [Halomonas sp. JS92-SW72]|uniref:TonB-dependent receptor domain-containing protein n=1 Tax=Halomonas sp. JS92-SW72 TaxID=2306583 RepID=UPI000E5B7552|nr:TonB-dependent receptor [Halomonas sp. JS92-SW72]AXY40959.1 TonB-dependent receptor [Halomonas sp. JS92-SW72]